MKVLNKNKLKLIDMPQDEREAIFEAKRKGEFIDVMSNLTLTWVSNKSYSICSDGIYRLPEKKLTPNEFLEKVKLCPLRGFD